MGCERRRGIEHHGASHNKGASVLTRSIGTNSCYKESKRNDPDRFLEPRLRGLQTISPSFHLKKRISWWERE